MATEPVIAGMFPDPSICRVGDMFYVANSSFEYLPGIPISQSTDLVQWTLIGNALTRRTQLKPHSGAGSFGICAPTIRHHAGRFWLVGTNFLEIADGQFILWADDPAGPWSDPVRVAGTIGIDPDIAWDDDGRCHLTWTSFTPGNEGIVSVPVDPFTGERLGPVRSLWNGTGLAYPEGPHLYRKDGWWYLLIAEGGTERGHAVSIARSGSLDGPWEPAPSNPILSHRSTTHPVQNTGHADLVELADGSWAMVHLGVRPRGQTPGFHVNGRETFLAGIDWIDGWPVVDEDRYVFPASGHSFCDDFDGPVLDPRWIGPGADPRAFCAPVAGGGVRLTRRTEETSPTALLTRVRDVGWEAEATIEAIDGVVRFEVRLDADHWYGLVCTATTVAATVRIGPAETVLGAAGIDRERPVRLRLAARIAPQPRPAPDEIEFAILDSAGADTLLGCADGRYLSTEVAGGFTGRMVGIEVLSGGVTVRRIRSRTTANTAASAISPPIPASVSE